LCDVNCNKKNNSGVFALYFNVFHVNWGALGVVVIYEPIFLFFIKKMTIKNCWEEHHKKVELKYKKFLLLIDCIM